MLEADAAIAEDAFLGGRIRLRQPRRGHRAGTDAVLLAALAAPREGETVYDLGAGVGAVGLDRRGAHESRAWCSSSASRCSRRCAGRTSR